MSALETQAQVDPFVARFEALFASLRCMRRDLLDLIYVITLFHAVWLFAPLSARNI